jgi:hypothetical protein
VHAQVLVGQMHEIWIQKTRLFERQSTILNEISFLLIVFLNISGKAWRGENVQWCFKEGFLKKIPKGPEIPMRGKYEQLLIDFVYLEIS